MWEYEIGEMVNFRFKGKIEYGKILKKGIYIVENYYEIQYGDELFARYVSEKKIIAPYKPCSTPKPKFKIGESVRFFNHGELVSGRIKTWEWRDGHYLYVISFRDYNGLNATFNDVSESYIYINEYKPHNFGLENAITNGGFSNWDTLYRPLYGETLLVTPHLKKLLEEYNNCGSTNYLKNREEKEMTTKLPRKVFFNDKKKVTTMMFGERPTIVKCGEGDEYSKRVGFLEAYFQAQSGLSKTQAKKYLDRILIESENK